MTNESIKERIVEAMEWDKLEKRVRRVAELKWKTHARKEHIAGVDYDCILHIESDYYI